MENKYSNPVEEKSPQIQDNENSHEEILKRLEEINERLKKIQEHLLVPLINDEKADDDKKNSL